MASDVPVKSYSSASKFFHWLIAIIVIPMVLFSFFLDDLPKSIGGTAVMLHKSFGLTVLFLMIFRLVWVIRKWKPALPASVPLWQRTTARLVQHALYITIIAMPLVGWIMSMAAQKTPVFFGLFKLPLPGIPADKTLAKNMFEIHSTLAWIIIIIVALHILGAIKHHFIDKDNVLKRMLWEK